MRVLSNKIIDEEGRTLILRGANLGAVQSSP
jgi:hypothetical protein